jgi:phosphoglycerol transferase MdoB-like AlkP superfamily enzyme
MTILLPTRPGRLPLREALGPLWLTRVAPLALLHLAALAIMLWSEINLLSMAVFALAWGFVNGLWLVLLRRPALAAALSLVLFAVLIMVSRFKFDVLWMSLSFIDVMIIDADTFAFLMMMFPNVRTASVVVALVFIPLAVAAWRIDPFRVHRGAAVLGSAACFAVIAGLSLINPVSPGEAFGDFNYVSHFTRTGVDAVGAYLEQGFLESDPAAVDELRPETACENTGKRPHIILVHDESSFDIRAVEGVKVPPGYGQQFRSFDGKARKLLVEGAGGPSWYTEYNVLSGLSSRSYGRFQFFVTRIAAGRVERGLPRALQRCGYRTHAIYPVNGGFLGASSYYKGVGIEDFVDGKALGSHVFEPDRFYFDAALRMIERDRRQGPMFLYVYLTANHFTWDYPFHPELTPAGWRDPGNAMPEVDEYLRRQAMSERDYAGFLARLKRNFPGEEFLIVRYGDHQPDFAKLLIDPTLDVWELGERLLGFDPRYFTTYYAIDAINFTPVALGSALDVLDAPYLPLIVQAAAGVPLDSSFAEQKRILERCAGLFYGCADGAEARRFNRALIEAGLIKGL